ERARAAAQQLAERPAREVAQREAEVAPENAEPARDRRSQPKLLAKLGGQCDEDAHQKPERRAQQQAAQVFGKARAVGKQAEEVAAGHVGGL
nr:hypothetical protein [Tanacetum cinerariifolium]